MKRTIGSLHRIKQKEGKYLRDFLRQFNEARFQTKNYTADVVLVVIMNDI